MTGLFEVSLVLDFHRLPELFCGFVRRPGQGLTRYPVACNPQAWAAGSAFMVLQACLGLSILASERKVIFNYPILPQFIDEMQINNLKVGTASVDLTPSTSRPRRRHHGHSSGRRSRSGVGEMAYPWCGAPATTRSPRRLRHLCESRAMERPRVARPWRPRSVRLQRECPD